VGTPQPNSNTINTSQQPHRKPLKTYPSLPTKVNNSFYHSIFTVTYEVTLLVDINFGVTMPKKVTPLNNTQIKQAKPKDKEYNLSDGDGLNLRVKPNGSKLWLLNY
jgi:hypothetical protein